MEVANNLPGLPVFVVILFIVGFAGVMLIVMTSFLKLVVVLHLVKSALGLHEVPPNMAINALALLLTLYVMSPVGMDVYQNFKSYNVDIYDLKKPEVATAAINSIEPLKVFMKKHSSQEEVTFFYNSAKKMWSEKQVENLSEDHFLILIPSFATSQLKSAFEVGFMIYLPFIIIDLIISNILLALGMIMVSPIVISLPFKLLLFVMVDGWSRLLHGLVLSYQ